MELRERRLRCGIKGEKTTVWNYGREDFGVELRERRLRCGIKGEKTSVWN